MKPTSPAPLAGVIQAQRTNLLDGYNAVGHFDADPKAEIVLVANRQVWLLDHDTTVKCGPVAIAGGGYGGPPTIADVDGNGLAEIVGVATNNCGYGSQRGVSVRGDPTWVDTRDVWNEHAYPITSVGQDGSIPVDEPVNWLTAELDNFRLNQYLPGEAPIPEPSALASIGLAWIWRRAAGIERQGTQAAPAVRPMR